MATALACETSEDWELTAEGHRAPSLTIKRPRKLLVLPWCMFASAAGESSRVKVRFAPNTTVIITGKRLDALLQAVAEYRVLRITQPTENEAKFDYRSGSGVQTGRPTISSIEIEGEDADEEDDLLEDDLDENEIPEDEEEQ